MLEIMNTVHEAVENARHGNGPTLIEMKTYRWKGHSKSDAKKYRTREEEEQWKQKDGIKRFKELLIEANVLTEEDAKKLQQEAKKEIESAVKFAENSPEPPLESLLEDVYA
jgi:acetoin:2,6-dichlorophenolindophenol oxidoreductase subunit alpha